MSINYVVIINWDEAGSANNAVLSFLNLEINVNIVSTFHNNTTLFFNMYILLWYVLSNYNQINKIEKHNVKYCLFWRYQNKIKD